MNPSDRRALAAQIADQLNADALLCDDVKFLITDLTATRLRTEGVASHTVQGRTCSDRIPRRQFDRQPAY